MSSDNLKAGGHLALAMLLAASLCNCSVVSSRVIDKAYFVPVVGLPEAKALKLYAVGKLKPRIQLTVLQPGIPETCIAKSIAFTKQSELSGTYFTGLSGSCETPEEFGVAIAKKPVLDYERLSAKEILETDEVTKIDLLTRNSGACRPFSKKPKAMFLENSRNLKVVARKSICFLYPKPM